MKYQYRNIDSRGTVSVEDDTVVCDISRGFSKWSYETPLRQIYPNPVRNWAFSPAFWACVLLGVGGLIASISQFFNPEDAPNPHWVTYVVAVLSIGLICVAIYFRREEWVSFPTEIESIWVRYCRSGPDRDRFDEFTAELCDRISAARGNADG